MSRVLRGVAVCLLPVLVGLYVAATTFGGGRFRPDVEVVVAVTGAPTAPGTAGMFWYAETEGTPTYVDAFSWSAGT